MNLAARLRRALAAGHASGNLPQDRVRDLRLPAGQSLVRASVLIAITERDEPGLILTQRSAALRNHPGQIAFPGGRQDDGDSDAVAAALREAHEEIALPPSKVEIVGMSDPFQTFTGFEIATVLAVVPPDLPLHARPGEVEDWFELPLAFALDPRNHERKAMQWEGKERSFLEINWQDRRIWGVTATIIANLSQRLGTHEFAA